MDLRVYHALEDLVKKVFDENIDPSDYLKRSERGAASGVASLDGGTLVPTAELGSGVADGTTFLRGDGTWVVAGITDHGALTGRSDDDHPNNAYLLGRAGGQVYIGGTGSGDDLILQSTSNGTRGDVRVDGEGFAVYLVASDAEPMFRIDGANDYLLWGPGGAGALDVRMIHSAKKLALDDNASGPVTFTVEGILRAEGLSGTAAAAIDLDDGATISAGAAGEVRLRSNAGVFEISENGAAFATPGGAGTFDETYNASGVNPTITVDNGEVIWTLDGGTIPTLSANTAMVWVNSSATGDNIEISLISGILGNCIINFGDSADEDTWALDWDNQAQTFEMGLASVGISVLRLSATEVVVNELSSGTVDLRVEGDSLQRLLATDASGATENLIFLTDTAPDVKTMDRGIFVGDVSTAPTGDPSAGGFMYSNTGAGTWRGSSGQVTAFGPAGPHCSGCGHDNWRLAQINTKYESWIFDCARCGMLSKGGPDNILDDLTEHQKTEIVGPSSTFADVCKAMGIAS